MGYFPGGNHFMSNAEQRYREQLAEEYEEMNVAAFHDLLSEKDQTILEGMMERLIDAKCDERRGEVS